ncbi:bestrophin [Sphingomonas oleivorans]|uniref:Bestrophin n=1 Tax=Sphingomonas oleivorans TaxID=1735121 RepID=A0A2T5G2B3_9SPHN|nr:bestrophin family protein [Sphingomonas oleivorans]PTQ13287.1 bestrophin [Sphingomonas oleivorans]
MIVRARPSFGDIVFALRGSIVPRIARRVAAMVLLAIAAVLLAGRYPDLFARFSVLPFTLIGIALSVFMSFRNNACYDRWWEGRRQWGQLVVDIRSFIRATAHLDLHVREPLLIGLCGFTHALAARLRDEDEQAAACRWIDDPVRDEAPNLPDAVLREVGLACSRLARSGEISEWRYTVLEARLAGLTGVQAACERIHATPLPFAYTLLLHRTAYLFCGLLPFALAGSLGWATPFLVAIVCYTFFGLDALGDELEDPFGREANDLPLDAMVRMIERELLAALGRSPLPEALAPVDHLLL